MISTGDDAGSLEPADDDLEDDVMDTDRCPECNSFLGIDTWYVCPECGAPILKNEADSLFDDPNNLSDDE